MFCHPTHGVTCHQVFAQQQISVQILGLAIVCIFCTDIFTMQQQRSHNHRF